jgi:hypothetical protein
MPTSSNSIILGAGEHTYEWVPNWGPLPAGKEYSRNHAVAETADGRILIHNPSPTNDCVCEFDASGKFIRSWGAEFNPGAHGMQLRREGNQEFLYFATTSNRKVIKTDLKGEHVFELDYPKEARNAAGEPCYADESTYSPTNVAFHPTDGSFYVADGYGSHYVHHYDAAGKYLRTWGGAGEADGQFKTPHGIIVDTRQPNNPRVLVADRANIRLQYFTLDGKYLSTVRDELRFPCHFDIRGTDLLIPDLKGRVTIFDKNNKLITHLGDNPDPAKRGIRDVPQSELVPGRFYTPHGAIWDRSGNIYVCEWLLCGRVTKLRRV